MFHHSSRVLCLLACVAGWSIPEAGQTVWRCGDTYSQKPCPGGKEVPAEDSRDAGQRAQTSSAARRDAKLADEMEKARLKEEAKAAPAYIPPPKAEDPADQGDRTRSMAVAKKPAHFTAVSPKKPGEPKPSKKAAKAKKTGS